MVAGRQTIISVDHSHESKTTVGSGIISRLVGEELEAKKRLLRINDR